jgi:hypothetical protein
MRYLIGFFRLAEVLLFGLTAFIWIFAIWWMLDTPSWAIATIAVSIVSLVGGIMIHGLLDGNDGGRTFDEQFNDGMEAFGILGFAALIIIAFTLPVPRQTSPLHQIPDGAGANRFSLLTRH